MDLIKGAGCVVMLVAGVVVDDGFPLHGLLGGVEIDVDGAFDAGCACFLLLADDGDFKRSVAGGHRRLYMVAQRFRASSSMVRSIFAKATFVVGGGAADELFDVVFADGGELENLAATHQLANSRRKMDSPSSRREHDVAGLHIRQQNVLLRPG